MSKLYKNWLLLKCMETYNELGIEVKETKEEVEIVVEGGMVVEVNGLPVDWEYHVTDKGHRTRRSSR